jgi:hypothetical protein
VVQLEFRVGRGALVGASPCWPGRLVRAADNAQQENDQCDDKHNVDDASGVVAEEAYGPDDDQDHGDGVKETSHSCLF